MLPKYIINYKVDVLDTKMDQLTIKNLWHKQNVCESETGFGTQIGRK